MVVVEHRIDDRGALRFWVRNEVTHRIGGLIKEGLMAGAPGI